MINYFNAEGLPMLNNLLPATVELVPNDDGTYTILTGGGQSQVDTGVIVDFNDPNTFFNLMKFANIDPIYWPKLQTNSPNNEQPSGSFDNL